MPEDALDTEDEDVDPSFDLDSSIKDDVDHLVDTFCEEWVRDDKVSLGLFLAFQLSKHLALGETRSAELAGLMVGRSDRTIRDWRSYFHNNDGQVPDYNIQSLRNTIMPALDIVRLIM